MLALITGAGGFVGRHLAEHLAVDLGLQVLGLEARSKAGFEHGRIVICDLLDAELTQRVLERYRPDLIFHLAAHTYVPRAFASPAETLVNNIVAQVNLLEGCRSVGLDPVVLVIGSAEQYGMVEAGELPIREDQPFRPSNPYAVSKVTQDMLGLQYHLAYGMKIVRVRPFNHIGPGQSDRFALSSFARQIAEAEAGKSDPVILVGNLSAERDFLDVRDVVRAYARITASGYSGRVFNVASGIAHSIQSLLERLLTQASRPIEVRQDPARMRPVDVPRVVGDASRLREAAGWKPEIPIEQSLGDLLEHWRREVRGAG